MRHPREPEEPEAGEWAAFDAALRGIALPDPDPSLRERCMPPGQVVPGPAPGRRVLVVDDEPNIRRLIELHLSRAGYDVLTAADGNEALARAREARPDMIILDVTMPGPDGFQVLETLKSDPESAAIPVLMLTARSGEGNILHGWHTGADWYMTKPFNPDELRSVVDRIAAVLGTPENPPPLRRFLK